MSTTGTVILTLEDGTQINVDVKATKQPQPGINQPPTCIDQVVTTEKGKTVKISFQATDPDPGDTITLYTVEVNPTHGMATAGAISGEIVYTPTVDFVGIDKLEFSATDNRGDKSTKNGVVSITVGDSVNPDIGKLEIESVKDNGNDGHVAANAINGIINNQEDRWSSDQKPAILSFTLKTEPGKLKEIHGVKIWFWKEAERVEKYSLDFSIDGINFATTDIIRNDGPVHEINLPTPIAAKYANFIGSGNDDNDWNSILEIEFFGRDSTATVPTCEPGHHYDFVQKKCVKDPVTPPPGTSEVDALGVAKMYADAPSGYYRTDVDHKFSEHNTGTRDTFYFKDEPTTNIEVTGIFNIKASKSSEEAGWKTDGGRHSDSAPEQGKCLSTGLGFSGRAHFYKEYPKHPSGSKHLDKCVFTDPNVKDVGSIMDKDVGIKVVSLVRGSTRFVEMFYDLNPYKADGSAANNWKSFFTVTDDGSIDGEAYLENQGVKNGGDGQVFMRIDTVTRKTVAKFLSLREVIDQKLTPKPAINIEREAVKAAETVAKEATSSKNKEEARETIKVSGRRK